MKTLYTAHATTVGGRDGRSATDDKIIDVQLSRPGKGGGTNPEQLFAAGYSACFGSAVSHVAQSQKIETGEISVTADVSLNQDDNGFFLAVTLSVDLPKLDAAQAQALVEKAHTVCPYSKATKGNIDVRLQANGKPVAKAA